MSKSFHQSWEMSTLEYALYQLKLRTKGSPLTCRAVTFIILVTSFILVYKVMVYTFITDISYHTDWKNCPACYGTRLCRRIHETSVHGKEGFHHINAMVNVKNVYSGRLMGEELVFKKLAHNDELSTVDKYICHGGFSKCLPQPFKNNKFCVDHSQLSNDNQPCDLPNSIKMIADRLSGPLVVEEVQGLSDAMQCPSPRLVQRVMHRYQEKGALLHEDGISKEEKLTLLYTLSVNPEPIISQVFPHGEGWPFPKYIGACGRMIAEENSGRTLRTYFYADWRTRFRLSVKLLGIADQLTNNPTGFKLYFYDVNLDNYVVNSNLEVTIADVENVLVVDEQHLHQKQLSGYNRPHVSTFDDCEPGKNCMSIDINGLCATTNADFNYYAVCRSLLSSYAQDEQGLSGGLLHSLPENLPQAETIKSLADQCAKPPAHKSRIDIKDQLESLLNKAISTSKQ